MLSNEDAAVGDQPAPSRRCRTASATWSATCSISCTAAAAHSPPNSARSPMSPATTSFCRKHDVPAYARRRRLSAAGGRIAGADLPHEHEMSAATRRSTRRCSKCPSSPITAARRKSEYEVRIKAGGGETSIWYKNDPLKVVGWKGDLFPYRFNIGYILPIMSDRIHFAPSSWATFEATGFASSDRSADRGRRPGGRGVALLPS